MDRFDPGPVVTRSELVLAVIASLSVTFLCSAAFPVVSTYSGLERSITGGLVAATPVLNVHLPMSPWTLDPHKMEDAYSMTIVLQLHRGLFRYTPQGEVEKDLAADWEEKDSGKIFRVRLREAKFSSGETITAQYVVNSFARLFDKGSLMAADLSYFEGHASVTTDPSLSSFGVRVINEREVEFRLTSPAGLFLKHLATADCAILPLKNFRDSLKFDHRQSYSGPYRLSSTTDMSATLEKWRSDEREGQNPPRVIHFFQSSESPAVLARAGKTDSLDHDSVDLNEMKEFTAKGWSASVTEITTERFVVLDPARVGLPIREHLQKHTPLQKISTLPGSSYLRPAYGFIPTGIEGALAKEDLPVENKSRRFVPSGSLVLHYSNAKPINLLIATELQKAWSTEKFKIELAPLSASEYFNNLFQKKSAAILGAKGVDYFDGYSVLSYFRSGLSSNFFYITDSKVDFLLDELQKKISAEQRIEKYKEVQRRVLEHRNVIPISFGSGASGLWSNNVANVPAHPLGMHTLPFETISMRVP